MLQDHVTRRSRNSLGWKLSSKSPSCKFGGYRHCKREDMTVLICHETLQDHLVKVSCDFVEISSRYNGFGLSRNPTRPREEDLMVSYHPAKFSDHWHCGSGNMFLVVEEEFFHVVSRKFAITYCLSSTWHAMLPHTKFQNADIAVCQFALEKLPITVTLVYSSNERSTSKNFCYSF